jgi:hypothetical protein
MSTTEERMRVLRMVEEGKVKPEDAAKLLAALSESARPKQQTQQQQQAGAGAATGAASAGGNIRARRVRLRVTDSKRAGKRTNVDLEVPIGLVGIVARIAQRLGVNSRVSADGSFVNIDELWGMIQSGAIGKILDVRSEDGEHIEVTLE